MDEAISNKLNTLENTIEGLQKEITDLKETINTLIKTTERMDSHISFVEATYETLRKPLDFIKEKGYFLTG